MAKSSYEGKENQFEKRQKDQDEYSKFRIPTIEWKKREHYQIIICHFLPPRSEGPPSDLHLLF